jgi:hypothetical protein
MSGSAFAQQKVHPDLNVPKVDFRNFDKQQKSIRDVLDEIEFDSQGEIEALSVTIPDYKEAATAFNQTANEVLTNFEKGMQDLKEEALTGSNDLKKLQGEYSSKLFALEAAMKKYPQSKDTFKKTHELEKTRMKADLTAQYNALISKLQSSYTQTLSNALQNSQLVSANVRKPNAGDRIANIVGTGGLAVAAFILWAAPAPIPGIVSPNAWITKFGDSYYYSGFWTVLYDAKESLRFKPKKRAYENAVTQVANSLFENCKTAACTYELSKSYKRFFLKLIKINKNIKIGDAKIKTSIKVKKNRVKKLLKAATEIAAKNRPTAVYVKHGGLE